MKNFKKVIILSIIVIIIVIYLICNFTNDNTQEFINEDIYVETDTSKEETNKIILHITGEIKKPRNYTNR